MSYLQHDSTGTVTVAPVGLTQLVQIHIKLQDCCFIF